MEKVEANLIQVYPSMGYTNLKLSVRPSFNLVACPRDKHLKMFRWQYVKARVLLSLGATCKSIFLKDQLPLSKVLVLI